MKKFVKSLFVIFALFATVVLVACGESSQGNENEDGPKYEYNTQYTDNLKLTEDYTNKSFVNEGIADLSKAGELGIVNAYSIIKRMTSR